MKTNKSQNIFSVKARQKGYRLNGSIYIKSEKCRLIYSYRKVISSHLRREIREEQEGCIAKRYKETFRGDGYAHYPDRGDGFTDICRNFQKCIHYLCAVYLFKYTLMRKLNKYNSI